ncbi:hypothetical protein L218DRAFT_959695 [Marasmius fiardii PR-910]|nr:hypothetical protein L218DRAFT_959695 [Marasmius fiardii PR-910]
MVYTTTLDDTTAQPITSSAPSRNNHRVATFAGAIGGSLGVLTLIALATFISIYYRRRKSAKRSPMLNSGSPVRAQRFDDADHGLTVADSSHSGSSQAPEMSYLPRYFPVTVLPRGEMEASTPSESTPSAPGAVPPPYDSRSAPPPNYDGTGTGRSSDQIASSPLDDSTRDRQNDLGVARPTSVFSESPPPSPARTSFTTPSLQFLNPQNLQRQSDSENLGSHSDMENVAIPLPPGIYPTSSEASATSDSRSVYSCSTGTRLTPSVRS